MEGDEDMAARVPARLTAVRGRRFGLTVGGAFLVFAAIAWWRGHHTATIILGALGGILSLAGLVIPSYLGSVERLWMKMAYVISIVTTPIVMGVMYLLVLMPIGFLRRIFLGNPVVHKPQGESYWKSRHKGSRASNLKRQY